MEQNLAVLMADLSGYTALTETHGATSAADLIDRYIAIVEDCLVGTSELIERTGDEIMIVSVSADCILSTAITIIQRTSAEENFLAVHGGLHYGTVLKRNKAYFGSTINLASRIAARANPGTFWCSVDFVNALSIDSSIGLLSRGKHSFKNVKEEKEISEIVNPNGASFVVDPVCRMLILDKTKAIEHPEKTGLFFCSASCLESFRLQHE